MMKNQKGITLIALVITIIVLLILAGVSIAMLTGSNGILNQANQAKSDTEKAEIAERVNMELNAQYSAALGGKTVFEEKDKTDIEANLNAGSSKNVCTTTLDAAKKKLTITVNSSAGLVDSEGSVDLTSSPATMDAVSVK